MHDFFVSYSRTDGVVVAKALIEALRTGQPPVACWIDGEGLHLGSYFPAEIDEAIRSCRAFVFVMTPDSASTASFCAIELARALSYKKPIAPVLAAPAARAPFLLEGAHYVDATGNAAAAAEALRKHLVWLESPAGQLHMLERYRLPELERALQKASSPQAKEQILEEIRQIQEERGRLQKLLKDPESVAIETTEAIKRGLEVEVGRRGDEPPPLAVSKRFVNSGDYQVTSKFQDRKAETALVVKEFLAEDSPYRLLVIEGRGGVGKTAFACRLLKAIEKGVLPDGLGALQSPDVPGIVYLSEQKDRRVTFAHFFEDLSKLLDMSSREEVEKFYRSSSATTGQKVRELLRGMGERPAIVLLDNFEELVDTTDRRTRDAEMRDALVALLQAPSHRVKVMMTTRLSPSDLGLEAPGRCMDLHFDEGLPEEFAITLLRELDAAGTLGLRDASGAVLAKAAAAVRGYPRAIEALAATLRDRATTLQELLGKASRALPDKVVEVMVGEAFSRLDPHAKAAMQALAILGRPVPAVAVSYVLQPFLPGMDASAVLSYLVNAQLVRKEYERGLFYLHPVDSCHALAQVPEEPVATSGHMGGAPLHRRALIEQAAAYFSEIQKPGEEWNSLADLDAHLAQFDLLCQADRHEDAARILSRIDFKYLRFWGHYRLVIDMHERLVGHLDGSPMQELSAGNLGTAYFDTGYLRQGAENLREAIRLSRESRGEYSGAAWWCNYGNCLRDMGQVTEALAAHVKATEIDEHTGDLSGIGSNLNNAADCLSDLNMIETAQSFVELALDLIPIVDGGGREALRLSGYRLGTLAKFLIARGRLPEAEDKARQAVAIGQQIACAEVVSRAAYHLALALLLQGRNDEADQANRIALEAVNPRYHHRSRFIQGIITLARQERADADDFFRGCETETGELLQLCGDNCAAKLFHLLAKCGRYAAGGGTDIKAAKSGLLGDPAIKRNGGLRRGALALLRLLAPLDASRELRKLVLVTEEDAAPSAIKAPGASLWDRDSVRRIRAALAVRQASGLHARGDLEACSRTIARAQDCASLLDANQLRELSRIHAWSQARRGFTDAPAILDRIADPGYVGSLLRVTDYMCVYRYQGLTPAKEIGGWIEQGQDLLVGYKSDAAGADVTYLDYRGAAALAEGDIPTALEVLKKALDMECAGLKDPRILARIRCSLGEAFRLSGEADAAMDMLEMAEAFQEEHEFLGDLFEFTLPNLSKLQPDGEKALRLLARAYGIAQSLGNRKAKLRIRLLEARFARDEVRQAAIRREAEALAAALPAVAACPLWNRIRSSWAEWCRSPTSPTADYWGL